MAPRTSKRRPLSGVTAQYDRIAGLYRLIEPLFLITPLARRKAVSALSLKPGDAVLEVGAGTGRNLSCLVNAVGPDGKVIAVDASAGMLAEARRLVAHDAWSNVELIEADAGRLDLNQEVDAVLFSLSYSVMPEPAVALARAWERMRPGARLVVMDAGLPENLLGRALGPLARLLVKLAPGDPYSDPWRDLRRYGSPTTERFLLGLYYVTRLVKS